MDQKRRRLLRAAATMAVPALAATLPFSRALAQPAWPAAPVRVIVPYGPGGASDLIGRMIAGELQSAIGGSFVVENKPGGGSQIGTRMVADAAGDGYTLGFIDTAFVINPALIDKLPYDTLKDFTGLSLAATAQLVLLVHKDVPAKTVAEFIALAKASPGKYSFPSAGVGSAPHLAGEQFRIAANLDVIHVPYKGGAAVFTDLIAGHVPFGFTTVPSMREHIRSGAVRALAVTGAQRSPWLPEVPSMAEAGLPAVDAMPLFGLVGPASLPAPIRERIGKVAAAAVRDGALKAKLDEMGFTPVGSTPDEFQTRIGAEIEKWRAVVKTANIRLER